MRFKNLTIILTLTCLSVVAFAGLVLLPITNGICEWTGDNSSKSYTNSLVDIEEVKSWDDRSRDAQMGRGWWINASLQAGPMGAYASVSPSIYGLSSFNPVKVYAGDSGLYGGVATVIAERKSVSVSVCSVCKGSHSYAGNRRSNEGQERTLTAKVTAQKVMRVTGISTEQSDQTEHEAGASLTAKTEVAAGPYKVQVEATGHYTWTHADGNKYTEVTRLTEEYYKLKEGTSTGQSRFIGSNYGMVPADTEASLNFNFEGHSSGNNVSYTADKY